MAGLINSRAKPHPAILSPQDMEAHMKLDPKQKQQVQRLVIAGMKVMFSPESHRLVLETLQGPGPIDQKLGQGVAGLMGLLLQEGRGAVPPNLVIPAGMILLAHAVDFLNKAGQTVSPEEFGSATEILVRTLLKAGKVDDGKVFGDAPQAPANAPPAAAPQGPTGPPQEPPQPGPPAAPPTQPGAM